MIAALILTLCLDSGKCIEVTATHIPMMDCVKAQQYIPQWMADNGYEARGYHLAMFRCQVGTPAEKA